MGRDDLKGCGEMKSADEAGISSNFDLQVSIGASDTKYIRVAEIALLRTQ